MTSLRDRIAEAKDGKFERLPELLPYAQFLGLQIAVVDDDIICTMPFKAPLIGNFALPALHGGTIGALLESTATFKLLWTAETDQLPKIINITIEYLRSGKAIDTHAQAFITKHGRRVVNVRMEAWQTERDRPIAIAHAHFLLSNE
jgi:uncharacterized protein (TIGR00369 family)